MDNFPEYMNKKRRDAVKQLQVVRDIFEKNGMNVADFTKSKEPYVFIEAPEKGDLLGGIRVYKLGDMMAYRVQKQPETHPFGKAYALNLEEMFEDLLSDYEIKEAGEKVMKTVLCEIKQFFKDSILAEKQKDSNDALGNVLIRSTGTDYANLLHKNGTNYG